MQGLNWGKMVFLKREDWIFVFSVVDYLGRIKYTLFLGRMLQETGIVWKMRKKSIQGVVKEISFRKLLYPLLTLAATLLVFLFVPFYRLWNPVKITSFLPFRGFHLPIFRIRNPGKRTTLPQ